MDREEHAAIFVRMMAVKEIPAARATKKMLISQANLIASRFKKEGEHVVEKVIREGQQKLSRFLIALYTESSRDFADYTLEQIGEKRLGKKSIHLNNFLRITSQFIHHTCLYRSAIISDNSRRIITRVIKKGQLDGLGNEQIAKNIRDKVKSVSDFRSKTIARTETHNAATYAQQVIAEQSDQDLIREWVAVDDDRTREAHADANGQQRDLNDPFDVDGEEVDRPGEGSAENSINCRCSLIYLPRSIAIL